MWDEWLKANNVICLTGVQYISISASDYIVDTFVREELNSTKKNLDCLIFTAFCK